MPTPNTNWKEATDPNAGSSVIYGAPDIKKISQLFNGDVDVDDVDINSEWYFRDGKLHVVNPAGTFTYIINTGAITADRTLDLPLLDANDTIVVEAQSQDLTNKGIDISRILGLPISATAIATGALPATSSAIAVDAESAGVDDLDTITGLADDDVVVLYANSGQTITVKHQASPTADQIKLQGGVDLTLSETVPTFLIRKGGAFYQFAGTGSNTFLDTLFAIQDDGDTSKQVKFSVGGATTGFSMTLVSNQTADRSLTLPDATDTLVARTTTDTLTNKTITAENNTIDQSTPNAGDYLRDNGTKFVASSIQASDLPSGVDSQKVTLTDGNILVGNASNQATGVTMSGDGTLSNTGVFTLDPVRYSSVGDLLHQINLDRNHAEYLATTPQTTHLETNLNVRPAHTTVLEGYWCNNYGMEEIPILREYFDGGNTHTTSPETVDGWLTQDHTKFKIDDVNERMTCQCVGDGTNDSVSYQLSQNMSNSDWTFRFRTKITAKADGSSGGDLYIGLSDSDSGTASNQNQDFIGFRIENSASTTYAIDSVEADNQTLTAVGTEDTYNVVMENDKWYYWEIIRTATNNFSTQFFGLDRKYLNPIGTLTNTGISTGINNIEYIKFCNDASITNSGDRTIQVDMLELWYADDSIQHSRNDGTNGPISTTLNGAADHYIITNEAKGTGVNIKPQMIFGHARPMMVENFSEYLDDDEARVKWLAQDGSKIDIDVPNKRINFNCVRDNSNDSLSFPLGSSETPSAVSNTEWELRFKLTIDSHFANTTTNAELFIGLSDLDSQTSASTAQDFIGCVLKHGTTVDALYGSDADAVALDGTQEGTPIGSYSLGTPYYIRVYRNSGTNYGVSAYSDPDYKIRIGNANSIGVVATCVNLDHFVIRNNSSTSTSDSTIQGKIEDIQVWSDGNWGLNNAESSSGAGTRDMHFDPIGFAIHMQTDRTTETQIKIRTNITGNLFFTDDDTVRTVNISDFSDDVFRFINMNRKLEANLDTPTAWIQIEGQTPFSAICINRIMYRRFNRVDAHFHHRIERNSIENDWDGDDPDGVRTSM